MKSIRTTRKNKNLKGMFLGAILFSLSILCLNAASISAASDFTSVLSPSKNSVIAGETFTISIEMSGLGSDGLGSANYTVGFDYGLFNYVSTASSQGGVSSNLSESGAVKLAFADFTGLAPMQNGAFATLTFTAKTTVPVTTLGEFSLSSAGTKNKNGDNIASSNSGTNVSIFIPSTNANLESLSLSYGAISPIFSPNITVYTATASVSVISINAEAAASATMIGTGNKNLNYGKNSFSIVVTAEDGTTEKTYTITINRPDNRSSNYNLRNLSVSNTDIEFNGNVSYTSKVAYGTTSIDIAATASDSKSTVSGVGKKNLQVGNNTYRITVTAENGNQKVYIITIIRKPRDDGELNLSKVNTLRSLAIEDLPLDFNSEIFVYNISVENNITEVVLHYELSDNKSSIAIDGKTTLDIGFNKISIVVTAENGEIKVYSLYIERKPIRTVVKNDDETILAEIDNKTNSFGIFVTVDDASSNKTVSADVLKQLSSSNKTLIYEVVNDDNGVIYSVTIDGSKFDDFDKPFNFGITFESDHPFVLNILTGGRNHLPINIKHDGKLPAGTIFKIFVADKFTSAKTPLYLYHFNTDTNGLELVQKNAKILNGYVELRLDHASEYVLLDDILDPQATKNSFWTTLITSITAGSTIIVGLAIFIINKKKKGKITNGEVPVANW